jgi:SAM-dependent methyltransferase
MTQNIYDDAGFFEGYSRLPRSLHGLAGAAEWASLRALLPPMRGLRVLDLGCGFGWFCRWAREQGAARVLGVDVSERMLTRAIAATHGSAIAYVKADLEGFAAPADDFDLAFSALALHYIENLAALLATCHAALSPGGRLVCSVEHPIFTAPGDPRWSVDDTGHGTWPVDRYLDEGPRSTNWLAEGVIKQHRTIGTYIDLLRRAGFTILHVNEWGPSPEQIAACPEWANERQRPPFLLMSCGR